MKVELFVDGKIYSGWKDVVVTRSIKALSGSFSLSITDRWADQREPWLLQPLQQVVLKLEGQQVIGGYIDSLNVDIDKSSRVITVNGRDKTADFIDCSYVGSTPFSGVKLEYIARVLAKQFNLEVLVVGNTGDVFESYTFNQGETCFEILDKAARQRGFLVTSTVEGKILITRPNQTRSNTIIEEGKNLLTGSSSFDFSDVFSSYTVKGQNSPLANEISGSQNYTIKAASSDESVTRFRPFVIVSETLSTLKSAQQRAQWEATTRAAKASRFKAQIVGWTKQDGTLWLPNELVRLRSKSIGVDDDLLIVSVKLNLNDKSGSTVELDLERKDAYLPEPKIPADKSPLATAVKKDARS